MNKTALMLAALILLSAASLHSTDVAVLYDGSWRIRGFATSKSIGELDKKITGSIDKAGLNYDRIVFQAYNENERSFEQIVIKDTEELLNENNFRGQITLLQQAIINTKTKYKTLVLVTDNVQDERDDGKFEPEKFYKELHNTPEIEKIDVIPMSLPFDGCPCMPGGWRKGNPGYRDYRGNRGIQAYIIQFAGDEHTGKHKKFIEILNDSAFPKQVMHVFPIDDRYLTTKPIVTESRSPLYTLESKDDYHLLRLQNPTGLFSIIRSNKLNPPIKFSFSLESHYDHFIIVEGTKIGIDNLKLSATAMNIPSTNPPPVILPDRLLTDMKSDTQAEVFTGEVRVQPHTNLRQEIYLLFVRPDLLLSFDIILQTREDGIRMDSLTRRKYYSSDAMEFAKIYSPDDLLSYMNPEVNDIFLSVRTDPESPNTTIKIESGRAASILTVFLAGIVIIIFIVVKALSMMSVKSINIQYDGDIIRIKRYETRDFEDFTIKNSTRIEFRIKNPDLILQEIPKREDNKYYLTAGVNYSLINNLKPTEIQSFTIQPS